MVVKECGKEQISVVQLLSRIILLYEPMNSAKRFVISGVFFWSA